MPYVRAIAICVVLIGFLLIGAPLRRAAEALGLASGPQFALWFCKTLSRLLGLRISESGSPAPAPAIVAPNHVSWTDVLVLGTRQSFCFLAKREVAGWPAVGALARAQGCVFVDRTRRMRIPEVNRQIADRLLAGQAVVLFAEATTGDGTRVNKFHSSHFAAARDALLREPALERVLVQPMSIVYRRRRGLPLGRSGRAMAAWYGDMDFAPSIWAVLTGGPIDCELCYGDPIEFWRGEDRKVVTRRAESAVRRLVGASLTGRTDPLPPRLEAAQFSSPRKTPRIAFRTRP